MTFVEWARQTKANLFQDPVWGAKKAGSELIMGGLRRIEPYRGRGVNVFDRKWDVCLVLDACRADLMTEVSDEYDWFDYDETIWSLGATSPEWIERTFEDASSEYLGRSGYVTWNAWSDRCLPSGGIGYLDEVWRYAWDDEEGAVLPRSITDRAITAWREEDLDRLVVHYMQPHEPFLSADVGITYDFGGFFEEGSRTNVWDFVRDGKVNKDDVWEAYLDNLRIVLNEIELLVDNLDAERVVITSDHGNAMGELEQYGHERNQPLACLHEVPWCVTSGTDERTYDPELEPNQGHREKGAEDRLRELGYL